MNDAAIGGGELHGRRPAEPCADAALRWLRVLRGRPPIRAPPWAGATSRLTATTAFVAGPEPTRLAPPLYRGSSAGSMPHRHAMGRPQPPRAFASPVHDAHGRRQDSVCTVSDRIDELHIFLIPRSSMRWRRKPAAVLRTSRRSRHRRAGHPRNLLQLLAEIECPEWPLGCFAIRWRAPLALQLIRRRSTARLTEAPRRLFMTARQLQAATDYVGSAPRRGLVARESCGGAGHEPVSGSRAPSRKRPADRRGSTFIGRRIERAKQDAALGPRCHRRHRQPSRILTQATSLPSSTGIAESLQSASRLLRFVTCIGDRKLIHPGAAHPQIFVPWRSRSIRGSTVLFDRQADVTDDWRQTEVGYTLRSLRHADGYSNSPRGSRRSRARATPSSSPADRRRLR